MSKSEFNIFFIFSKIAPLLGGAEGRYRALCPLFFSEAPVSYAAIAGSVLNASLNSQRATP